LNNSEKQIIPKTKELLKEKLESIEPMQRYPGLDKKVAYWYKYTEFIFDTKLEKRNKEKIVNIKNSAGELLLDAENVDIQSNVEYLINLLEFFVYMDRSVGHYYTIPNYEPLIKVCENIKLKRDKLLNENEEALLYLAMYILGIRSKNIYYQNGFKLREIYLKETFNYLWMQEFFSQLKGVRNIGGMSDIRFDDYFEMYVWKYLPDEKKSEFIAALNETLKNDLQKRLPAPVHYSLANIISLVIYLGREKAKGISIEPFINWRDKGFHNIYDENGLNTCITTNLEKSVEIMCRYFNQSN